MKCWSLLMYIPPYIAIDVARRRLLANETLSDRTYLIVDSLIITLLEFCLNATFLTFGDTHYQLSFGTAMGSPVSVTVANLVMEKIEDLALSTFEHTLQFWKRYVDDTITALQSSKWCQPPHQV